MTYRAMGSLDRLSKRQYYLCKRLKPGIRTAVCAPVISLITVRGDKSHMTKPRVAGSCHVLPGGWQGGTQNGGVHPTYGHPRLPAYR